MELVQVVITLQSAFIAFSEVIRSSFKNMHRVRLSFKVWPFQISMQVDQLYDTPSVQPPEERQRTRDQQVSRQKNRDSRTKMNLCRTCWLSSPRLRCSRNVLDSLPEIHMSVPYLFVACRFRYNATDKMVGTAFCRVCETHRIYVADSSVQIVDDGDPNELRPRRCNWKWSP